MREQESSAGTNPFGTSQTTKRRTSWRREAPEKSLAQKLQTTKNAPTTNLPLEWRHNNNQEKSLIDLRFVDGHPALGTWYTSCFTFLPHKCFEFHWPLLLLIGVQLPRQSSAFNELLRQSSLLIRFTIPCGNLMPPLSFLCGRRGCSWSNPLALGTLWSSPYLVSRVKFVCLPN